MHQPMAIISKLHDLCYTVEIIKRHFNRQIFSMDIKDLRPKVFAVDPQSSDARKQWSHWFRSFGCYVQKHENISDEDKLS